ncbi:hypothetical protein V8G54_013002, partial [Vigna mungo]
KANNITILVCKLKLLGLEDPERFFSFILLRIHINSLCLKRNKGPIIPLKAKGRFAFTWFNLIIYALIYFFLPKANAMVHHVTHYWVPPSPTRCPVLTIRDVLEILYQLKVRLNYSI